MDELLVEVKNYLDITWDDIALDAKLEGFLARGKLRLDNVTSENTEKSRFSSSGQA